MLVHYATNFSLSIFAIFYLFLFLIVFANVIVNKEFKKKVGSEAVCSVFVF